MYRTKFFLLTVIIFAPIFANAEVKPYMDQMLNEIFTLKPYIVYEEEYANPKNHDVIKKSLDHLAELSKKINHDDKMKKSTFNISAQVLSEQLQDVATIFENGNKDYSLWTLRSTLNVCMSCHTQLPAVSTRFNTLNTASKITNYFNEAEFLFTVRNFDLAIPMYSLAVKNYPKDMKAGDLEKVLLRKAYYFVRVKRNALDLVASLKIDLNNKDLPPSFKKSMTDLIQAVDQLKSEDYPNFEAGHEGDLKAYVEKQLKPILSGDLGFLTDKNLLTYLRVSSLLYEYIDKNPKTTLMPDILYWLSFCERRYTKNLYYSLPELYLKKCITDYPKNPVAKSCYKEYEEIIVTSYTGSAGVNVPADVKTDLLKLKKSVGVK